MKNSVIISGLDSVLANVSMVEATSILKYENLTLPKGFDMAVKTGSQIYGFVSNNFGLIKPMDVYETFGSEFEKSGISFDTKGKIDQRGNWELRFKFDNPNYDVSTRNVGDEISAMLGVGGGLAGSRSFYLNDMIERLVCLNGMTRTQSEILLNKVRNTKKNHVSKLGIDFEILMPLIHEFISNHSYIEEQKKLIDMELKDNQILPFFYEITKGSKFPESKFQDAFDRMKLESAELGFTAMNRYLAYAGLNYILEHDSMAMDLVKTKETDQILASRVEPINIGMAVKNFNVIVKNENERISSYQAANEGKSPRGKQKLLELV